MEWGEEFLRVTLQQGGGLMFLKILQLENQQLMNLKMCYCNQLRLIDFLITFVF